MSHTLRILIVAIVGATGTVHAEPTVFPLTVKGDASDEVARELTGAVVTLSEGRLADAPIERAAQRLGCDPHGSSSKVIACLEAIARAHQTSTIVFGSILAAGDRHRVKLVRFEVGSEPDAVTFALTAETPKRLAKRLLAQAASMFGRTAPPEEPAAPPPLIERAPLGATPPPPRRDSVVESHEPATRPGAITKSTYAILGGGAAVAALGIGFHIAARSLRADVLSAPRDTLLDIQRLLELEHAGATRMRVGNLFLAIGGGAIAVGVVRAILQRRATEPIVEPVAIDGGAALVVTGSWR